MNAGPRAGQQAASAAEQQRQRQDAPPPLEEALDSAWFGLVGLAARAGGSPQQDTRQTSTWLSWLFSGSSGKQKPSAARSARRPAGGRAGMQRARANGTEGAPARLPRPPSAPKLQSAPSGGRPPAPAPSAGTKPSTQGDTAQAVAATAADALRRKAASSRAAAKQASYAERRQAWRQRIDAIKAKQAARSAAAATGFEAAAQPSGHGSAGGSGPGAPGPGGRVYSKHVAIPVSHGGGGGSRAGSGHSTPYGSPRREPLLDAGGAVLPQLEAPPVWLGFQTAEAPADLAAASEEQLHRFLAQAGWLAEAVLALPDRDSLVAAARAARGAWEVERVMVACTWPEEVLRVPRKCTDLPMLKSAYRRVSMAVHPDKCSAAGASDAMSIVADCYNMLLAAASCGRAASVPAVPAFMRSGHPTLATRGGMHASHSVGSNLAGAGAGGAGKAVGTSTGGAHSAGVGAAAAATQQARPPQPQRHPSGGLHSRHGSAGSSVTEGSAHGAGGWAEWQRAEQQRQQQEAEQLQQGSQGHHANSAAAVPQHAPLPHARLRQRSASGSSQEHWNPHGQLSSEEKEAIAAALDVAGSPNGAAQVACAAGSGRTSPQPPSLHSRSRNSSSSSIAAAQHLPARSASSGSSEGGGTGAGRPLQEASAAAQEAAALRRAGSGSLRSSPSRPPNLEAAGGSVDTLDSATQRAGAAWPGPSPAAPLPRPLSADSQQHRPQHSSSSGGAGAAALPPQPGRAAAAAAAAASGGPAWPHSGTAASAGSSGGAQPKPKIRVMLKVRQA